MRFDCANEIGKISFHTNIFSYNLCTRHLGTNGARPKIEARAIRREGCAQPGACERIRQRKANTDHPGVLWRIPTPRRGELCELRAKLQGQFRPPDKAPHLSIKQIARNIGEKTV